MEDWRPHEIHYWLHRGHAKYDDYPHLGLLDYIASFLLVKFQASSSWDSSQSVYVRSWVPVLEDQSLGVYVRGFCDYKKICRNRKTLIISVESHLGLTFAI